MTRKYVAVAGLMLLAGASAAAADPVTDCGQYRNQALRLKACSEVVAGAEYTADQKARAFRNRGSAHADAGAHAKAIADLDAALKLNPADAIALATRGFVRISQGNADAAIADLTGALRLSPGSTQYLIGRGHAYLVKGRADDAIADLSEAIGRSPASAGAYNHRGLAWRKKGDDDKAIADYTSAISINPSYALAYANRGHVLEARSRKAEAIADFTRALQLDPSMTSASAALKRLGSAGTASADLLVNEGKALVEVSCSRCHATGKAGASPNPNAPEFRTIHTRHPVLALREPLARGIAAPHSEMPKFTFTAGDIDKIIAYINTLQ